MLTLRPYQVALVDGVREAFRAGHRAVVMQSVTGSGKTATISVPIASAVERGRRVLFLAMLDAILDDTAARLRAAGVRCGIVQADRKDGADPDALVKVCSVQTLASRPDVRPPADLIVIDECQHATCASLRTILADYPHARVIGLTATPQRGDETSLGDVFTAMVQGPSIADLTSQGFLVPARVIGFEPGDSLGMDPVDAWQRWCADRPSIVFAANVEHALEIAARIPASAVVTGETPFQERRLARAGLADGSVRAVVTCRAWLEGMDAPTVSGIVLCQAFTVVSGFLQGIGRGLRPSPGKQDCLVIDLRGAVYMHGLPDAPRKWTLDGKGYTACESLPNLRRCRACHAVFPPARKCPVCGSAQVSDPRPVRVQNREHWEVSTMPVERRVELYRARIRDSLLKAGKPAWLAEKIASRAVPAWAKAAG